MIEYIRGTISSLSPTNVIIETCGIGYDINITLPCFTSLEGQMEAKLLIHEVIREDAHILYGFVEEAERSLFRALNGVSGVGANTARMILSALAVPDLEQTIINGDAKRLKSVKGIGLKTAERIIVDLKDKIKPSGSSLSYKPDIVSEGYDEALSALIMLGFPRAQSTKVLDKLYAAEPMLKVEVAIKKALAMM